MLYIFPNKSDIELLRPAIPGLYKEGRGIKKSGFKSPIQFFYNLAS